VEGGHGNSNGGVTQSRIEVSCCCWVNRPAAERRDSCAAARLNRWKAPYWASTALSEVPDCGYQCPIVLSSPEVNTIVNVTSLYSLRQHPSRIIETIPFQRSS